jgi:hypothetical protein
LNHLNDLSAAQPVGQYHVGVDGTDDVASCLIQNGSQSLEERFGVRLNQLVFFALLLAHIALTSVPGEMS